MTEQTPSRKEQILQALAHMLEAEPGGRITTAGLAREGGVSEAALYRHFPSKAKMFEGLIDFIEEAIFSRINRITGEGDALTQVEQILTLILAFTERNPGITRLLTGDALTGESLHTAGRAEDLLLEMACHLELRGLLASQRQTWVLAPKNLDVPCWAPTRLARWPDAGSAWRGALPGSSWSSPSSAASRPSNRCPDRPPDSGRR